MLYKDEIKAPAGLVKLAQAHPPARTLVAGANSLLVFESIREAQDAGLVDPVCIGIESEMKAAAEAAGYDLDTVETHAVLDKYAEADAVTRLAADTSLSAIMKGQIKTDAFMSALLNDDAGMRTGIRLTHVFYLTFPETERALMVSDAALNVAPNAKTFQAIIRNAVTLAHRTGNAIAKVAILSATETVNPSMPTSQVAADLSVWTNENVEGAMALGPLALDNAISPDAAAIKGMDHPVAGGADILVVPNIETGNALFKSLVYFAGACSAGLVMGGRVPIILTSRADPPAARISSAALAAIVSRGG